MRALVLSGGGAKGAFEVGVVNRLHDSGNKYDIFCGTSVGAINAAHLAQFAAGDEKMAVSTLQALWCAIDTKKVYTDWNFLGKLNAFWKPSVYTTAPLRRFIAEHLDTKKIRASGKRLRVSAVSLHSGRRRVWNESDVSLSLGVIASSAMPAFFEPVRFEGELYVDGGIRQTTPLVDAISCGATEVDVIVLDEKYPEGGFPENPTVLDIGGRTLGTMLIEIEESNLHVANLHNRLIEAGVGDEGKVELKIRILRPGQPLGDALSFAPDKIRREMAQGYADASEAGW